jgi:predicted transcriptional regulator
MNISEFYKKSGENDASLSRKSGIPQPTIWRVRTGRVVPLYETAVKISNAVGGEVTAMEIMSEASRLNALLKEQDEQAA